MSRTRAVFHFRAGGFDLKAEGLGHHWEFEREDRRIVLSLPATPDSFGPHLEAASVSSRTGGDSEDSCEDKKTAWEEGRVLVAAVSAIEVAVDVDVEISSPDLVPEEHADEITRGQAALDAAFPVALSVANDFISWLRVRTGRYWLAPSHEPPDVLNGELYLPNGRRVRNISFNPVIHITGFGQDAGLTVKELNEVASLLKAGYVPSTADVLLADARETLTGPSVEDGWRTTVRDVRRAILLAAIACEVKIKATLVEKASLEKRELAEVIVKNIREVQVAIGELPHKAMKAAVGRSLHEDDPDLFKAVKKLFSDRNNIAHRGEPPTLDEARDDLVAAVELSAWLDSLAEPADATQEARGPSSR
jgi:hypothetical protein